MSQNISSLSLILHSLGWALLYSLLQGVAVFSLLFLLLKLLANTSAKTRYSLALSSFAALLLWFVNTWINQWQRLKGITLFVTQSGPDSRPASTYTIHAITPDDAVQNHWLHNIAIHVESAIPFLIALYTIGLSFMLLRIIINFVTVTELRTKDIMQPGAELEQLLTKGKKLLEISRPVQLLLSQRVNVPIMLGTLKPVILLPIATLNQLTVDQLETILLHELAHIKRYDYLLNILQTIAEIVLFFNPFVWAISSIVRRERELCCDDLVVDCTDHPLSYARALAILEFHRAKTGTLAMAATGPKNQLFNRIKRIMEMKKTSINYAQFGIIVFFVIALTVSAIWITPTFAQKAKNTVKKDTTQAITTVSSTKVNITIDQNGKKTSYNSIGEIPENVKKDILKEIKEEIASNDEPATNSTNINVNISDEQDSADVKKFKKELNATVGDITSIASSAAIDAIKQIDWDKIKDDISQATSEINKIDWDQITKEINNSMADAKAQMNDPKMRKEISAQVKKALQDSKKDIERAKKDIARTRIEMREINKNSATAARVEAIAKKDRITSDSYQTMLNKMERDGLINKSEGYKIEKDNDVLYINGIEQPDNIYEKYDHYLQGNKIIIKGSDSHLKINVKD